MEDGAFKSQKVFDSRFSLLHILKISKTVIIPSLYSAKEVFKCWNFIPPLPELGWCASFQAVDSYLHIKRSFLFECLHLSSLYSCYGCSHSDVECRPVNLLPVSMTLKECDSLVGFSSKAFYISKVQATLPASHCKCTWTTRLWSLNTQPGSREPDGLLYYWHVHCPLDD